MSETVLVTGAAGFAGGHVLDLLASEADGDPHRIVAWHRPGHTPAGQSELARWEGVDILDKHAVEAAVARARPTIVYHCAGAAHPGRAWEQTEATFAINVWGTDHLLNALAATGDRVRLLIPSSALVYRPSTEALTEDDPRVPAGPYGLSKLAQELVSIHAIADGISVLVARAFNHIGPRQDPGFAASGFARQIAEIEAGRQPPAIHVGNLTSCRDLTDVRDTVRAYRAIVEAGEPGRAYNVCSGRVIETGDLLRRLLAFARQPIEVVSDPGRLRPIDVPVLLGNPARLRRELGWAPEIPLDTTLRDVLEYWRGRTQAAG